MSVRKARLVINLLAGLTLVASLVIKNEMAALVLTGVCVLSALGILYAHLPRLSHVSPDSPRLKTVRFVTIFNAVFIGGLLIFAALAEKGAIHLTEGQARWVLAAVFGVPMMVFGNAAPKLPFNRHAGLRLPWTVSDEDTWVVAHRILGYLSLPLGLLCFAAPGFRQPHIWLLVLLGLWIAVPGGLSYLYFWKKYHGTL